MTEPLADALITGADESAVVVLLRQPGGADRRTQPAPRGRSLRRQRAVKTGMVHRASLPVTVAERLVVLVSEELRDYLLSHHALPPAVAADLVLQSRERSIIGLSARASRHELELLIRQMQRHQPADAIADPARAVHGRPGILRDRAGGARPCAGGKRAGAGARRRRQRAGLAVSQGRPAREPAAGVPRRGGRGEQHRRWTAASATSNATAPASSPAS